MDPNPIQGENLDTETDMNREDNLKEWKGR